MINQNLCFITVSSSKTNLSQTDLTLWQPGYDIFVLWNRPKTSSC